MRVVSVIENHVGVLRDSYSLSCGWLRLTEWRLISLHGEPLPKDIRVTLRFVTQEPGWMDGEIVCNFYSLRLLEANSGQLAFGDGGGVTDIHCADDPDHVTNHYINTLHDASQYDTQNDQLRMVTADGRSLVFGRADWIRGK